MTTTPRWLHEPCPPWCVSEHAEDDLPEDRFHDGAGTTVSVIVTESAALDQGSGAELLLHLFRKVGQPDDWLHVSAPEAGVRGFTITLESARRLGVALSRIPGDGTGE